MAQVAGAGLVWLGGWGLPAGVSACGEVAGAGGPGCWGFGLRRWLLGLGGVAAGAGGGGWLGSRGGLLASARGSVSARWRACFGLGPGPLWFGACGWGVVGEISVGAGFG